MVSNECKLWHHLPCTNLTARECDSLSKNLRQLDLLALQCKFSYCSESTALYLDRQCRAGLTQEVMNVAFTQTSKGKKKTTKAVKRNRRGQEDKLYRSCLLRKLSQVILPLSFNPEIWISLPQVAKIQAAIFWAPISNKLKTNRVSNPLSFNLP